MRPWLTRGMVKRVRPIPKRRQRRRLFLKEWREYRGHLTQTALADRAGVSQGMVSQLENGTSDYTGELLHKLADALGCEPQDIIMRNPMDSEAPWTIWEGLPPTERVRAVEVLKALKRASGS